MTPLSSRPASPEQDPSSSSSSTSNDRRRPSHGASASASASSSYFTAPNANASLSALTAIRNIAKQHQAHKDSVLSENQSDDGAGEAVFEEEGDDGIDEGVLRTGNARLRRGSQRLRRQSSTLGEGAMAHWKPSPKHSRSNSTVMTPMTKTPNNERATNMTSLEKEHNNRTANLHHLSVADQSQEQSSPVHAPSLAKALHEHLPEPTSTRLSSDSLDPSKDTESDPSSAPIIPGQHAPVPVVADPSPGSADVLSPIEQAKRLAAYRAVDVHIKPHHKVIGIGSGSTVPYVVDRLLEMGEQANRHRWFIPTGFQSKELIVNAGLKLGEVDQFPSIDVTIDGADDVDLALNAIKGGGACHLREKVLAEAANEFVIIADYRKNNKLLGESWKNGIPIETPPFAWSKVLANIKRIPGSDNPILRMGKAKAGPLVTDNGNFVIDAPFDSAHMREPEALLMKLKMLTGVVEVGLFIRMARAAYFGNADGSVTVRWCDGQEETLREGQEAKILNEHVKEGTDEQMGELLLKQGGGLPLDQDGNLPERLKQKLQECSLKNL